MKKICSVIAATLATTMICHAQANTQLSNLVSPTKVNQSLIPGGTTGTKDLGSNAKRWRNGYFNATVYGYGVGSSYGVYGTGPSYGVYGYSSSGYGVAGVSGYLGVYGSGSTYGLYGSGGTYGLYASGSSYGVYGYSSSNYGVYGTSGYLGVYGSGTSYGVYGYSGSTYGVYGATSSGYGVTGSSSSSYGGYFSSSSSYGLRAATSSGFYAGVFDGNVWTSGAYYTSDKNLKKNINDFDNAMSIINKLQPKNYEFKTDQRYASLNLPKGMHYGLLAQDLEQILPNLVKEAPHPVNESLPDAITGANPSATAQNMKQAPSTETMNIRAVNYTELIPIMIKGMQELGKENEYLKKQVNTLTQTVNQLTKSAGVVSASNAAIGQNFPNPFTRSTVISFSIPKESNNASIVVSQTGTGKVIKTIPVSAATSQLTFDGSSLATGAYSYSLYVDGKKIDTKQMIISK